uniref:IrrE N-terminal-like domain-containing protein n=1 Tax=Eubacterium plexicaudatum ASF492 TaxID=1235802 RepID=N1ZZM3_9FIRM
MKIIIFKNNKRSGDIMKDVKDFEEKLIKRNVIKLDYSLKEIDDVAYDLLNMFDIFNKKTSIPIVKIVKAFNFKTYTETLSDKLSGDIYINGDTKQKYGHNKIILVNKNEPFFHQRFVIAHELAHYLFDFLGKDKYHDSIIKFSDTYYKNQHETPEEKRANRFAASLLMPEKIFIEQYKIAKNEDCNELFVILYLSEFFQTPTDSIEKRIWEVVN